MSGSNRAQKVGIAYEVDKKLEQNYDREEEAGTPVCVVNWINAMCEDISGYTPFPGTDWKSICMHLRNGIFIGQMINKLLKMDGKPPVKIQPKANQMFVALTNIENFNEGALNYGLSKEFTFQSGDLWECRKGPFLNVLNCIHSLGFVANSKQVMPSYLGEISKTIDRD